jgi:hypothetical protein
MVLVLKFLIGLVTAMAVGAVLRLFILPVGGPWSRFWTVFLLLFLSAWAAGIWFTPLDSEDWGLSIMVFALVALVVAVILLLSGFSLRVPRPNVPKKQQPETTLIEKVFQVPFWTLIAALAFMIILRYTAQ